MASNIDFNPRPQGNIIDAINQGLGTGLALANQQRQIQLQREQMRQREQIERQRAEEAKTKLAFEAFDYMSDPKNLEGLDSETRNKMLRLTVPVILKQLGAEGIDPSTIEFTENNNELMSTAFQELGKDFDSKTGKFKHPNVMKFKINQWMLQADKEEAKRLQSIHENLFGGTNTPTINMEQAEMIEAGDIQGLVKASGGQAPMSGARMAASFKKESGVQDRFQTRISEKRRHSAAKETLKTKRSLNAIKESRGFLSDLQDRHMELYEAGLAGSLPQEMTSTFVSKATGGRFGTAQVKAFKEVREGMSARLKTITRDTGVLTDQDRAFIIQLLPDLGEHPDVVKEKMAIINNIFNLAEGAETEALDDYFTFIGIKTMDPETGNIIQDRGSIGDILQKSIDVDVNFSSKRSGSIRNADDYLRSLGR